MLLPIPSFDSGAILGPRCAVGSIPPPHAPLVRLEERVLVARTKRNVQDALITDTTWAPAEFKASFAEACNDAIDNYHTHRAQAESRAAQPVSAANAPWTPPSTVAASQVDGVATRGPNLLTVEPGATPWRCEAPHMGSLPVQPRDASFTGLR
jgi:hypothetical protein